MIAVREATGHDVPAIREIFLACYGTDYTDPRYYDDQLLTRLVYSEGSLLLVAEETETGQVIGTASVDLEVGTIPTWWESSVAWPFILRSDSAASASFSWNSGSSAFRIACRLDWSKRGWPTPTA